MEAKEKAFEFSFFILFLLMMLIMHSPMEEDIKSCRHNHFITRKECQFRFSRE